MIMMTMKVLILIMLISLLLLLLLPAILIRTTVMIYIRIIMEVTILTTATEGIGTTIITIKHQQCNKIIQ